MRRWLVGLCIALSLAVPMVTEAATSCTCFCGTAKDGAIALDGTFTDSKDCIETCRDEDKEVVGCYQREDQYPENSEICWTREQCLEGTQTGYGNDWHDDVPDCDDQKEPMGYCYAGPKSISTIIAISGNNTFASLAEYIDALYRYLVPTMAVVAVVMVMIAGLQYILSRGNPSAVKQAKERIAKAVVGLILLLSAYTLAYFLDPRLVEFTQLRIPKIKQVVMLSPGSMCETLALAGIEVDNVVPASFVDKTCSFETGGTKGVVTDIANVKDEVDIGNWKEGDTCNYSKCDPGATCMSTGCIACSSLAVTGALASVDSTDVTESTLNAPPLNDLTPSQNNCALLSDEGGGTTADKQYCVYTTGGLGEGGPTSSTPMGSFFPVSCMQVPIECTALQSTATEYVRAGTDACAVYGDVEGKLITMIAVTMSFVDYTVDDIRLSDYVEVDTQVYKKVCNDDPCGIRALQGKVCAFTVGADGDSGTCAGR